MAKRKGSSRSKAPRIVEQVEDSDDEEIDEDEAFNSEDERKYGSFFASKDHAGDESDSDEASDSDAGSEDEDGLASDDDDPEGDGGQYMLDLLNQLDKHEKKRRPEDEATIQAKTTRRLASHVTESEFASAVVANSQLTLDNLMESLQDTQGYGVMQKTLSKVSAGKAASIPLSKTVSDRAQRKIHYEHETEKVAEWVEAVQENRKAETLDFRHKERLGDANKASLVDKFVPTTDFEKELNAALEQAGQQDEETLLKQEEALMNAAQDDLGSGSLSMEEYKKRRAQLAKMRALMFYHEQKRHHINKIKSKKYRRIRKRQRERLKEAEMDAQLQLNPDLADSLQEKEEVERMKERMTLAHKNTSKWAKRMLKRGKNIDTDTRKALSAQLQRGEDLRKKMNFLGDEDGDSDLDGEDNLVEAAKKVLADTTEDNDGSQRNAGLFKLSFMQKGIQQQRERAKEEARQLLRELEANEKDASDSDRFVEDEEELKPTKKEVASKAEMESVHVDGKMVSSSLEFGASHAIAVAGGIDIDLSGNVGPTGKETEDAESTPTSTARHSTTLSISDKSAEVGQAVPGDSKKDSVSKKPNKRSKSQSSAEKIAALDEEANPWMLPAENDEEEEAEEHEKRPKHEKSKKGTRNIQGVSQKLATKDMKANAAEADVTRQSAVQKSSKEQSIASLSQEELVRRAFAGPDVKEVEEDFAKEKALVAEKEDPTRKRAEQESKTVSGWGSWAGEGAPVSRPPRLPKRLRAPEKKLPKRKRQDDKKPNVIINEKRQKKTANQFQIAQIPYPFTSREEYEKSMAGALGKEWNVTSSVKNFTRPEILTRSGKIIQPISKKVKQKRAPAKF